MLTLVKAASPGDAAFTSVSMYSIYSRGYMCSICIYVLYMLLDTAIHVSSYLELQHIQQDISVAYVYMCYTCC
jgi:hypothetical protein